MGKKNKEKKREQRQEKQTAYVLKKQQEQAKNGQVRIWMRVRCEIRKSANDIEVQDGVRTVCFAGYENIFLRDVRKQFPDVEELCIAEEVQLISMDNFLFPNVNPPRLIRFRGYRRGFQSQQRLSPLPVTLGNIGYLTTDTAQTQ